MPQQEPGWGRARPFGSGAGCREQNVPARHAPLRRAARERAGPGPGPSAPPGASPAREGSGSGPGGFGVPWGLCVGCLHPTPGLLRRPSLRRPREHRPAAAAAVLPSPPWRRQQLFRTLFWMFMGFQFTPGFEAAKLPSRGASNPPRSLAQGERPLPWLQGGFQTTGPPPPRGLGRGLGKPCLCQGLAAVIEKSAANKILMGTYCIL